jgi:heterodisulfide reductase subunit B
MGCVIPNRLPFMELAIRETMRHFDIPAKELEGFTCCPNPLTLTHLDHEAALAISARNLAIAEAHELPILTPCHGCFESLKGAAVRLNKDSNLRNQINEILGKIGYEYKGTTQVKHFIQLLYEDIGTDAISEAIVNPLTSFDAALHIGCHILRPSPLLEFDNPQRPVFLHQLVRAIGITPIRYQDEMDCCGYGTRQANSDISLKMLGNKLTHMKKAGAQAIIVICPACTISFDLLQRMALRYTPDKETLPVFYYPELLCLALGTPLNQLGFDLHRVKVDDVLSKILPSQTSPIHQT